MMRKKKRGRVMTGVLAGLLAVSCGTVVCKANYGTNSYNFTQYAYEDYYDNVSDFSFKDTTSDMYIFCGNSTAQFRVSALGSNNGVDYADCSGGYRYFIQAGESVDDMVNWIREDGYKLAGVKGEYMYDAYFHASGHFVPDPID